MKATLEQIKTAYVKHKSLKKVASLFGLCHQSVHERLKHAGIDTTQAGLWTPEQIEVIKDWYSEKVSKNTLDLQSLAKAVGKTKQMVCRKARSLGLTNQRRVFDVKKDRVRFHTKEELSAHLSATRKAWIAKNGHPRGALGMRHTPESKELISQQSKINWQSMTTQQREQRIEKSVITRVNNNTPPRQRVECSWKSGWREIGPQRIYARSRWEANIARVLEFRRMTGDIQSWEHEPMTFWFEKIKRGVRSYKPDFRVVEQGKEPYFIEVKGWMDARSRVTLKRMKKYHPSIQIELIDSKRYAVIKKQMQNIVGGWESDARRR
jgi:hypothetical protein